MPCRHCPHCRKWAGGRARREAILAIRDCPDCDDYGRLEDLTDCPRHVNWAAAQALNEKDGKEEARAQ